MIYFYFFFKFQECIYKCVIKKRKLQIENERERFQNFIYFEVVIFGFGILQWFRMDNYKNSLFGIELREKVFLFFFYN